MSKGVDVSQHNEKVDWAAVKRAGFTFAMVRMGYGKGHLDNNFYRNINGALDAGLKVGVYHYSYALTVADAKKEAAFVVSTLKQCGLTPEKLIGVYYDMEDADGYKSKHGMPSKQIITNICSVVKELPVWKRLKVGLMIILCFVYLPSLSAYASSDGGCSTQTAGQPMTITMQLTQWNKLKQDLIAQENDLTQLMHHRMVVVLHRQQDSQ